MFWYVLVFNVKKPCIMQLLIHKKDVDNNDDKMLTGKVIHKLLEVVEAINFYCFNLMTAYESK